MSENLANSKIILEFSEKLVFHLSSLRGKLFTPQLFFSIFLRFFC